MSKCVLCGEHEEHPIITGLMRPKQAVMAWKDCFGEETGELLDWARLVDPDTAGAVPKAADIAIQIVLLRAVGIAGRLPATGADGGETMTAIDRLIEMAKQAQRVLAGHGSIQVCEDLLCAIFAAEKERDAYWEDAERLAMACAAPSHAANTENGQEGPPGVGCLACHGDAMRRTAHAAHAALKEGKT